MCASQEAGSREPEAVLRRPFNRALRLRRWTRKSRRILHRQIRQNLAIQFNPRNLQPVDELVVAHPIQLRGSADAHDPQRTELPLTLLAPRVGKLQSALDGFFCRAVKLRFCEEVPASAVK